MSTKLRIFKNSFFLTVQPLFMNFISLFVMGYMARKLGPSDFGIFNFVTTFTMLFYPLAALGLDRVNVRDLAGIKDKGEYAGKMLPIRLTTSLLTLIIVIFATMLMGYEERTVKAMYLACLVMIFQLFSEFFTEIFNSLEKMEFTALIRMIAGLTLTILSVVVLYYGYGLFELIGVYAFGQFLGVLIAVCVLPALCMKIRINIDTYFVKEKIKEGLPFFVMTMMWFVMMRLDTIFLSKKISMVELGLYTSAIMLVRKISVIPQGISSSLLPAISRLRSEGKENEISDVMSTFLNKIVLVVFPGCIIVSIFSNEIMTIIFGKEYVSAGVILRIAIWVFLLRCFAGLEFGFLTAFRKQGEMMRSYIISTCYCVVINFVLIYIYGSIGAVIAFSSTQLIIVIFFTLFTYKLDHSIINGRELAKIVLINLALFLLLIGLKTIRIQSIDSLYNIFWIIPVGVSFYVLFAVLFKLLNLSEILSLGKIARRG